MIETLSRNRNKKGNFFGTFHATILPHQPTPSIVRTPLVCVLGWGGASCSLHYGIDVLSTLLLGVPEVFGALIVTDSLNFESVNVRVVCAVSPLAAMPLITIR